MLVHLEGLNKPAVDAVLNWINNSLDNSYFLSTNVGKGLLGNNTPLTLDEIKQDAEVLRLRELMRSTANSINERLLQLFKENNITLENQPLFEALNVGSKDANHLNQ